MTYPGEVTEQWLQGEPRTIITCSSRMVRDGLYFYTGGGLFYVGGGPIFKTYGCG